MKISIVPKLAASARPDLVCRFSESGLRYDASGKSEKATGGALQYGVEGNALLMRINVDAYKRYEREEARRAAAGLSVRELYRSGNSHLCWYLDGDPGQAVLHQLLTAALLADYSYDEFKKKKSSSPAKEKQLTIVAGSNAALLKKMLTRAEQINEGVITARNLANTPANYLAPLDLAAAAKKICSAHGLSYKQLSFAELEKGGYIGLTSVGKGSENPPVLFTMTYKPAKVAKNAKPICLVGKGITFDTGGISIKPWDGMWDMKADMGGAAAVVGAMHAIALTKPSVPVVAVVASAENMPDGKAYRPGDILRYRNGLTVEIRSTDAEGRLVLADALLYAQETLKQQRIVEFSTLTGACVRALGPQYIGLMSRSEQLKSEVKLAAGSSGESVWELPLHPEYRAMIDSPICDMRNSGGALAGAQTAGWFLQEFIEEGNEYVHLDIAGTFLSDKEDKYWRQAGATGSGVRLSLALVNVLAGLEPLA